MSASNPHAPPRGAVRDVPGGEELELAGRGWRLLAWFLDGVIASVMVYVPALVVAVATRGFDQPSGDLDSVDALPLAVAAIGFIAWAWITLLLVARYGQTIAKRMLEIRVVRSDGSQASLGRIFWLRNVVNALLSVIPLYFVIDSLFICGARRQCIHDLIADTIVVKA